MRGGLLSLALVAGLLATHATDAMSARQAPLRPSASDRFPVGAEKSPLCQAERTLGDPAARGMFDRAFKLVCRDAAIPVGTLYAVRTDLKGDPAELDRRRGEGLSCEPPARQALKQTGDVDVLKCKRADGIAFDFLKVASGKTVYFAEGLAGYRSALDLALRSLIADRAIAEPIEITLTGAGDAASFARVLAENLDPAIARGEAYRRNGSGSYAEASAYFDALLSRASGEGKDQQADLMLNRALQLSGLGQFDAARALFDQAMSTPSSDPVTLRQRRNYRAIDLINQGSEEAASAILDAPIATTPIEAATSPGIDAATATLLNERVNGGELLGLGGSAALTPSEKIMILDAQADALRGTILRFEQKPEAAQARFVAALNAIGQVRDGRVRSAVRLRAQIWMEQAALDEDAKRPSDAEQKMRAAVDLIASEYPQSVILTIAQARLARFLLRRGANDDALALYRQVVIALNEAGGASPSMSNLLEPYFAALAGCASSDATCAGDLFFASQTLLRPGVADTQVMLARQLSGGSDEAARLFREALNVTRLANAARVEQARLKSMAATTPTDQAAINSYDVQIGQLDAEQVSIQSKLAQFPAYRAISTQALSLADLQGTLRDGEGYWKLSVVGRSIFSQLVTKASVNAWKIVLTSDELAERVDAIRGTITVVQAGSQVTYPFDAVAARQLYGDLAGPAAADLPKLHHLIFEPDGAMQRLPVTLLIYEQNGLDRYVGRVRTGGDPFDMTGIAWLGGEVDVSIALSARAFRDVRSSPPSTGARDFIGFGQNAPVAPMVKLTSYRPSKDLIDCRWPFSTWDNPIAARELIAARSAIDGSADIVTDAAFNDSNLRQRTDLASYRILHFATHGLITAPRPQCPAEPALLTSFGDADSDGLLSFGEIYGLHLDADLVVLSACDTAGAADVATTRAAGIVTGGGNALDGLVRAFIGAGARSLLASHWPIPDDYNATERLIGPLYTARRGTPLGDVVRSSMRALMASPEVSHPFYWAAFALIGDGAQPAMRVR